MLREMGIELVFREVGSRGDISGEVVSGEVVDRSGEAEVEAVATPLRFDPEVPAPPTEGEPRTGAAWLVVSEAFVAEGPSGRLLDHMLRAIDVARTTTPLSGDAVRRAEVVAVDISGDRPGAGAPDAAAEATQRLTLARRIDAQAPRCIIALGRGAARALLGTDEPLGALRGRPHAAHGVPVVVSFAPAYLLRHPADKSKAWSDLCLAVRTLDAALAG